MLSVVSGVQEYIQAMVGRIQGMKVLILDADTIGIVSMVYSQSDILQHEVFLVECIDSDHFFSQEKMRHMNAVCLLRPTNKNFLKLSQELKNPKYNEYHLHFSNVVPHTRLEQLAMCDEYECVQQVQEFFADVYAVNHDLFSLNLPSTVRLTQEHSKWTSYEESNYERIIEGLLATCLTLRLLPAIRYTSSSELTRGIANRLHTRISEEPSLFDSIAHEKRSSEPTPVLLILDRRNDPVTPLLNQWTYQAQLHELLGMENNRIDMSKVPGIRPELEMIVMSPNQDQFLDDNLVSNFGDLGVNIKQYVETYQKQTKNTAKIESIEEMQRFVDEYPEFRKLSGDVSKHVAVVHELSRLVETNGLLEASQLEQELACSENRQEHFRSVADMIRDNKITNMERLRLVLLFALRYENEKRNINELKDMLVQKGIGPDQCDLVDQMLQYAGAHARNGDLFGKNSSFLQMAKNSVISSFKGVENVYTQHKTHLMGVVDSLMKGKLKESSYPYIQGFGNAGAPSKDQVPRAVVFVVGGCTFEEARDVMELNKSFEGGRSIVLGGTTIHNSRTFLTDVAQMSTSQ